MSMKEAFNPVRQFEETIAKYCGSSYAVAVESCTAALFLCCKYVQIWWVDIPKHTYHGVPNSIIHAGGFVAFTDEKWYKKGYYKLKPYPIYDSAVNFVKGMYIPDTYWCLSFQYQKHIPIGRGGMILTDSQEAVKWFRKARCNGRREVPRHQDKINSLGWNMYMTPEQASRGLVLFEVIKDKHLKPCIPRGGYVDLSQYAIYTKNNKG